MDDDDECDELYGDLRLALNKQHQETAAAVTTETTTYMEDDDDECDELYGDLLFLNKQFQPTAASQGDLNVSRGNEENLESMVDEMDMSKSQESEDDFEIILNDMDKSKSQESEDDFEIILNDMDKSKSQESEDDFEIILNDNNNPSPPQSKEGFYRRGSDFSLPPDKTIFNVNLDLFEDKRWKHPGVDTSDFFNYDLNEDKWKEYCKALEKHQLELMQKESRIHETGRVEQHIGRPIPVEIGPGDRIPSYELPPLRRRRRGIDTIIEVQLSGRSEQEQQSERENRQ